MFSLIKLLVLISTFTLSFSQVSFYEHDDLTSNGILLQIGELIEEDDTDSKVCKMQLQLWKQSLDELWAQQLLDASGKIPTGILSGNTYDLGQFDECIRINAVPKKSDLPIRGKYCTGVIPLLENVTIPSVSILERLMYNNLLLNQADIEEFENDEISRGVFLALTLGICFPASCKSSQIDLALKQLYKNKFPNSKLSIYLSVDSLCSTAEPIPWTAGDWGAIAVLSFLGILMISSTLYDIITHFRNGKENKIEKNKYLVSFSVWTNTVKLLKNSSKPGPLSSLNGIRVLTILWVIMGHRYSASLRIPPTNIIEAIKWIQSYSNMFVVSATVSVDTFFLLGGLLLSYTFFNKIGDKKSFNIFIFYLHRFLRITPALALIILIQTTLYKHIGDGPLWKLLSSYCIVPCQKNWWVTLLYVQNYVNTKYMCLDHSWYLGVDMQLYLLSPILLYPILRNAKIGMILASCWTLLSLTTVTVLCYVYGWSAAAIPLDGDFEGSNSRLDNYYFPTHARATPWLIGFIAGYFLTASVKRSIRLNKIVVFFGWAASFAIMGAVIFGMGPLQQMNHVFSHLEDSTYLAFNKTGWSLAVLWVIFACSHGYGGPVNWFLSWKMWEILGRLSFSMYLVHYNVLLVHIDTGRAVARFSNLKAMHLFFGDTITTILFAYLLAIMIEIPVMMLEKAIFNKGDNKRTPEVIKSIQNVQD